MAMAGGISEHLYAHLWSSYCCMYVQVLLQITVWITVVCMCISSVLPLRGLNLPRKSQLLAILCAQVLVNCLEN